MSDNEERKLVEETLIPGGSLEAGAIELEAYEDDGAFLRLRSLSKPKDGIWMSKGVFVERLEEAMGYNKEGISAEEQRETIRILSTLDPVYWDIVQQYVDDNGDYSMYLKKMILAAEQNAKEIQNKYDDVFHHYMWTMNVEEENLKYKAFMETKPSTLAEIIAFFVVVGVIGLFVGGIIWLAS